MVAERNKVGFDWVASIVPSHASTAGLVPLGLQLFELAPHLVDGLVELLHPILERGVEGGVGPLRRAGVGEGLGGGAAEGEVRPAGALRRSLELAAPFGFPQ